MIIGGRYSYDEIMNECTIESTVGEFANGILVCKHKLCYYTFSLYRLSNNITSIQLYTLIKKSKYYES